MRMFIMLSVSVLMIAMIPVSAPCQDTPPSADKAPAVFESIWGAARLYANEDNPVIQSCSWVGRYHGQYWNISSEGSRQEDWENRRFYAGFNTKLFQQFTLEVQININDDFDPVYAGLYDAFIQWKNKANSFAVSLGRLDYVYTGLERSTSSKKIKTMERGLVVNQVMPGEVIGLYARGQFAGLEYQAGLFSGSIADEFTHFDGDFAALVGFSRELPLFYRQGTLHLDYLFNNGHADNNAFKPYRHIVSLWHEGQWGPLAMGFDLTAAHGVGGQSDLLGLTLLPSCDLADNLLIPKDKLQLALRYHFAASEDDYGLGFSKRYEQKVASGRGDTYNAFYLGLNYYIYGQKLKLMAGAQYFDMAGVGSDETEVTDSAQRSIDGWEFISGVRLYF